MSVEPITVSGKNLVLAVQARLPTPETTKEIAQKDKDERIEKINFFSSNLPNLNYLYPNNLPSNSYVDRLEALSSLKESGLLTESEFKSFKRHLLKMISLKG